MTDRSLARSVLSPAELRAAQLELDGVLLRRVQDYLHPTRTYLDEVLAHRSPALTARSGGHVRFMSLAVAAACGQV